MNQFGIIPNKDGTFNTVNLSKYDSILRTIPKPKLHKLIRELRSLMSSAKDGLEKYDLINTIQYIRRYA